MSYLTILITVHRHTHQYEATAAAVSICYELQIAIVQSRLIEYQICTSSSTSTFIKRISVSSHLYTDEQFRMAFKSF
jgi:hypothetical protein